MAEDVGRRGCEPEEEAVRAEPGRKGRMMVDQGGRRSVLERAGGTAGVEFEEQGVVDEGQPPTAALSHGSSQ